MDVTPYIQALDLLLLMDRKLIEAFNAEEVWPNMGGSETVGFDAFYEKLASWAVEQTDLTYEDFAKIDLERNERLHDYKKGQ